VKYSLRISKSLSKHPELQTKSYQEDAEKPLSILAFIQEHERF